MNKIRVLEDDKVNEYEIEYDQEYMDIILEEYRRTFSYLEEKSFDLSSVISKEEIKKRAGCADDIVCYSISGSDDDNFKVNFVSAINPTAYIILKGDNNSFCLDENRVFVLYSWYKAIADYKYCVPRTVTVFDDFLNLEEKKDTRENLTGLLNGVSLRYVGEVEQEVDLGRAQSNKEFIDEFHIQKEEQKVLKK